MTRRAWEAARPYALPPLVLGLVLVGLGRKAGWALLGVAGAVLAFFRDPERETDYRPGTVYAAADGLVAAVEEVEDPFVGGPALSVSVFLSLHNVHVNRSPVSGVVSKVEEIGGGYAPALFSGSDGNRRNRIEVRGERGPVVVVPKAGMIARRISTWVRAGDALKAGERIGLIHFGSRTDVVLPASAVEVLVRKGDRTRAGLTPIARYHDGGAARGEARGAAR